MSLSSRQTHLTYPNTSHSQTWMRKLSLILHRTASTSNRLETLEVKQNQTSIFQTKDPTRDNEQQLIAVMTQPSLYQNFHQMHRKLNRDGTYLEIGSQLRVLVTKLLVKMPSKNPLELSPSRNIKLRRSSLINQHKITIESQE